MLKDHLKQEPSKSDMAKKVQAYKTLNEVLVKTSAEFMKSLQTMLHEKQTQHAELQKLLDEGNGTEGQNATFIFLGGYIQCLQDILSSKTQQS